MRTLKTQSPKLKTQKLHKAGAFAYGGFRYLAQVINLNS
jgi:hypothetical protein